MNQNLPPDIFIHWSYFSPLQGYSEKNFNFHCIAQVGTADFVSIKLEKTICKYVLLLLFHMKKSNGIKSTIKSMNGIIYLKMT